MLALFLVCFVLFLSCFCFVSCFAFTDNEKHCFPCNSSILSHVGYKVVLYYSVTCFCSCLFFLCCLFPFRHLICIMLCLCCLVFFFKNRAKWFCCLHLVVIFPFWLFRVEFCLSFVFSVLSKEDPKKPETAKTPKKQKCRKNGQKKQLAQLCSRTVFLIFWVWA